jgi:membrane-bound lytic murein transglycosylase B
MRRGAGMGRSLGIVLALVATAAGADTSELHGWRWLVDRLVADGVPRGRAIAAFTDARMPPFDGLDFGLYPREPHALYRGFLRPGAMASARRCRDAHRAELARAEARTGVPADVVASIIHVESGCGRNTGTHAVLPGLARLAMANEPSNLERNLARHTAGLSGEAREAAAARTRARGRELEAMFYPEVLATFTVADRLRIDPLSLRGSGSGAFGVPQFLPGSYLKYGADGDGDGAVSLYDPADAILSCARYLQANGWRPGLSRAERRRVIWSYNHSDAYIDTVLAIADHLGGAEAPLLRAASARRTHRAVARRSTTRAAVQHGGSRSTAGARTARKRAHATAASRHPTSRTKKAAAKSTAKKKTTTATKRSSVHTAAR